MLNPVEASAIITIRCTLLTSLAAGGVLFYCWNSFWGSAYPSPSLSITITFNFNTSFLLTQLPHQKKIVYKIYLSILTGIRWGVSLVFVFWVFFY